MERYQTFGNRIVALLVDAVVFTPLIVFYIFFGNVDLPNSVHFILIPAFAVISLGYNILLHWKYGQTIGKMVAKVKVLDISEKPIGFGQSFLREILYVVTEVFETVTLLYLILAGYSRNSETVLQVENLFTIPVLAFLVIDTIVCLASKKNRALHDLIAGTVVVRLSVLGADGAGKKFEPPGPEHYDELQKLRAC